MEQDKENIVIKVGTTTLTQSTERISEEKIDDIGNQISELRKKYYITLVSSGAIATARQFVDLNHNIPNRQALAAIGQPKLMSIYDNVFEKKGIQVAQCLLTYNDFTNQTSRKNTLNTLETLLGNNFLPIINENDTVATDEIKIGDNDRLSAMTAALVNASKLIICSDVNGLYDRNPKLYQNAKLIREVQDIDMVRNFGSGSNSNLGTGGMVTKLCAADTCMQAGIEMWILNSERNNFILDALDGKSEFTRFRSNS